MLSANEVASLRWTVLSRPFGGISDTKAATNGGLEDRQYEAELSVIVFRTRKTWTVIHHFFLSPLYTYSCEFMQRYPTNHFISTTAAYT